MTGRYPLAQVEQRRDRLDVPLWYPRLPGHPERINVDLVDVVVARTGVSVRYDYRRNGFCVERFSHGDAPDLSYVEVAFVAAANQKGSTR